jgi:uncharacterized oxidoreductase
MRSTGNTILITGGGKGIGRGLAESFHKLGNQVIIAGRNKRDLDETTAANPGMASIVLDMTDSASRARVVEDVQSEYSDLNVLINNAGIAIIEDLRHPANVEPGPHTVIETNLQGPLSLTNALLAHLQTKEHAAIIFVSSGLAFVPNASTPTYCATKAFLHSYTQSLRYQLKGTTIQVLELIPPYVQTTMLGPGQATDPHAMPLDAFISKATRILTTSPNRTEICVDEVLELRNAAYGGPEAYEKLFQSYNDAMNHVHS